MLRTFLVLGLTPSDTDCLQHNFLATANYYIKQIFFYYTFPINILYTGQCRYDLRPTIYIIQNLVRRLILEEWFSLQGERAHSLLKKNLFFEKSNLNPNCIQNLMHSFIALLSSSVSRSNMSSVVATIFSGHTFLSSSVSMANHSILVAASFSSLALLSY